jgi:hypothetical protein
MRAMPVTFANLAADPTPFTMLGEPGIPARVTNVLDDRSRVLIAYEPPMYAMFCNVVNMEIAPKSGADKLTSVVTSVSTFPVANVTCVTAFDWSTYATVSSFDRHTALGLENLAAVPTPSNFPPVPAALPAINEETFVCSINFLTLLVSVKIANELSADMAKPTQFTRPTLVPVPSQYIPPLPVRVLTSLLEITICLMSFVVPINKNVPSGDIAIVPIGRNWAAVPIPLIVPDTPLPAI